MPFSPSSRALAIAAVTALSTCNQKSLNISTVTFERTPCFGTCPVYRVSVNGSGSVTFEGIRNVDSVGKYTGQIDSDAVNRLAKAFAEAKYFELRSSYNQATCSNYGTDAARILTSIATPDSSKSVDHDLGCGADAPAVLPELYRKFDEIVGVKRWIGNR